MNVGFVEAIADFNWTCVILHDVDMLPEDARNIYSCPEQPRHMTVKINDLNYKLPYPQYFGGAIALLQEHYRLVNGFSNKFWGWGAEDDDMYNRIKFHKLTVTRYQGGIARYKMIKHKQEKPSPKRGILLSGGAQRYSIS